MCQSPAKSFTPEPIMMIPLAGFAAGCIHVLAGPDHLAAIAPIAARHGRNPWMAGVRWGLGHASGACVVGAAALLLRGILPIEAISSVGERMVGILLIGIAAWALRKALQIHSHTHEHGGHEHEHIHMHGRSVAHLHRHAAFAVGTLHGVAGTSHLMGVLPALALPTTGLAALYLAAFAAGTVAAMALFAHLIGGAAARLQVGRASVYRGFMFACSAVALVVGVTWLSGNSF